MVLFLMSTYFTCVFVKLPPLDFVPCSVAGRKADQNLVGEFKIDWKTGVNKKRAKMINCGAI
jgi:hypothetical protein